MSPVDGSTAAVESREAAYLVPTYSRTAFHPRTGRGARLFDADGKRYWDLLAGIAVNALGYSHPRITRILRSEARGLLHVSNLFYHPCQGLLAERLIEASGLSHAFFCNSGTEANEAAIKFARLANPGRPEIIALEESFHGRTMGALSVTGHEEYRVPFGPLLPGVTFVPPNDHTALERTVSEDTAAIIVEPILGEGGVIPLSDDYLRAARRLADRSGAVLIFDEIQCGLGRTGTLFAFQGVGVTPDIVTLAKPLGGGLPLGAVIVGPKLDGSIKPGHHGTTFGGNVLACRLGLAVLEEIDSSHLLERVKGLGAWLETQLRRIQRTVPAIIDIRGRGLMWGIELNRDAKAVALELLSRGYVVGTARQNVLRLLPPYIVPKSALAAFLTVLVDVLTGEKEES
ncbi:MAG: acetylornithine/succinylornithine family transaminase [Acidobacteria bacterium]|nr:acetylornithine/succinylornithine family transaminase [Acidobacteriota bacterium]